MMLVNKLKRLTLLFVAIASLSVVAAEKKYTVKDFAKRYEYTGAALSPDGKYVAFVVPDGTTSQGYIKNKIAVLDLETRKPTTVAAVPGDQTALNVMWLNDNRFMFRAGLQLGYDAQPKLEADFYAMDADGGDRKIIYGPGVEAQASKASRVVRDSVGGYVADVMYDDDKHIIVAKFTGELVKLNIYTGAQYPVDRLPPNARGAVLDKNGQPLYASGQSDYNDTIVYKKGNDGWERVAEFKQTENAWTPLAVHEDGERVYVSSEKMGKTTALAIWNPKNDKTELVYSHPFVDHSRIWSQDGRTLLGVEAEPGYLEYKMLNTEHKDGKVWKILTDSFPKYRINVLDITTDGDLALFQLSDATNPGDYYLFDMKSKKAEFLVSQASWLDPNDMADKKPIEYKTRDGLTVRGYLTLPKGKEAKNLPLVVQVHGGPHGPRDQYAFEPDVQWMAYNGYAVLQVNYRGSGGYGKAFERMGHRKWGREMQDDVTDATKWAIDQGIADKDRVCIAGASYGGYATSMGLVREPELYQCGIGGVGVYDLTLMYEKGDIQRRTSGEKYLQMVLGENEKELKANSAVYNADKITKPVFLWQGAQDERVPDAHYYAFAEALKKAGKEVELLIKDDEGHGFVEAENREELFSKMLAFLDKHIGK
ncbi:MAG: S9 family peptidase [Gammaproteobacteria bacterium]|nr:S9 family peptidase [Gammaproteobacteria bacterium]